MRWLVGHSKSAWLANRQMSTYVDRSILLQCDGLCRAGGEATGKVFVIIHGNISKSILSEESQ